MLTPTLGIAGAIKGGQYGGIPGAIAAGGFGAYEGSRLGSFIQKRVPPISERFGLPPEPEPAPLPANEGGTVSRGTTIGAKVPTGPVPPASGAPPVRTAPIGATPAEPATAEATPRMSVQDQIGLAKSLGYRNVGEAMTKLGGSWDAMVNGLKPKPTVAEPPSVRPGSPTPFPSDAPLTPADLMNSRMNTRIPTWEEVERQGQKERFYAEAPQVKTKNQLVNEGPTVNGGQE